MRYIFLAHIFLLVLMPGCQSQDKNDAAESEVANWSKGIVWYQIMPERFRNGDPGNDPSPEEVPWAEFQQNWRPHPWTSDWYKIQPWELTHSDKFLPLSTREGTAAISKE